ncbi:MAG: ABC transporter substrate-binding protein [Candidatus Hinthialibacter antarcticus]|nr:ABC transporter substrate-binding protein [Candidatus Hinthialibacter antarcticus]
MKLKFSILVASALVLCCFNFIQADEEAAAPKYGDTPAEYVPFGKFTKPYKEFFLEPLEYTGYGRNIPEPQGLESIRIGFIGPIESTVSVATGGMSHEEPLGVQMLQGAKLAIQQANANGGYRGGVPFELMVHNDNGLWGASGSEIIDMAYKEKCWAVLGTIDGANSHIAIRVALKCEIPVMNTGDTDPTFIETNIPWVFRCVTDDRQMCYLLSDYVFKKLKLTRVAALRAGNRYGRMSIDEFRDAAKRLGHPFMAELQYPLGSDDMRPQLKRLQALDVEAIITYGDARESALLLKQMREMGMQQWLIGSDRMVSDEFFEIAGDAVAQGKVAAGYPFDPTRDDPKWVQFQKDFQAQFNTAPGHFAAHSFDGMNMVLDAINQAGLNRALIRDALANTKTYHGVTGDKVFDAVFTDRSPATLALLEDGEFEIYTQDEVFD